MSTIYDVQSQRNPAYAGHPLGVGVPGATIGAFGCFITSAAMILTHYLGKRITPVDVDTAMDQLGLYVATPGGGRDLWPDGALRTLFNHFGGTGTIEVTRWDFAGVPADLSKLAMSREEERLVIVDFDHNPNDGIQIHAMRPYSWDGKTLIVDDPWYGTRDNFTKNYGINLGLTIQAIVGYRLPGFWPPWEPRPAPTPAPDPLAELRAQLAAAQTQVVTLSTANLDLTAKLKTAKGKAQEIAAL